MLICPKCNRPQPPSRKVCTDCGAELQGGSNESVSGAVCPKCGVEAPKGQKFCGACGTAIEPEYDPSALTPEEEAKIEALKEIPVHKALKGEFPDAIVTVYDVLLNPELVWDKKGLKTELSDLFEERKIPLTILTGFFEEIQAIKEIRTKEREKIEARRAKEKQMQESAPVISTILYAVVHIAVFVLLYLFTNIHLAWLIVWTIWSAITETIFILGGKFVDKEANWLLPWLVGIAAFASIAILALGYDETLEVAVILGVLELFVYMLVLNAYFVWVPISMIVYALVHIGVCFGLFLEYEYFSFGWTLTCLILWTILTAILSVLASDTFDHYEAWQPWVMGIAAFIVMAIIFGIGALVIGIGSLFG